MGHLEIPRRRAHHAASSPTNEDPMNTSPPPIDTGEPVPPHAPLGRYYDDDAKRHRYVIDLFNETAQHYNTIEE